MDPAYKAVVTIVLLFVGTVALVAGLCFARLGVFR